MYSLLHVREDGRPFKYEGESQAASPTPTKTQAKKNPTTKKGKHGVPLRYESHKAKIRLALEVKKHVKNGKNGKKVKLNFFYRCSAKYKGDLVAYTNFGVILDDVKLTNRGLLVALAISIQHNVEAVRHEWLDVWMKSKPMPWWPTTAHIGTNTESPASQGMRKVSFYTAGERLELSRARSRDRQRKFRANASRAQLDDLAAHKLALRRVREAKESPAERRVPLDTNNTFKRAKTAEVRGKENPEETAARKTDNTTHWNSYGRTHREKKRDDHSAEEKKARLAHEGALNKNSREKSKAAGTFQKKVKTRADLGRTDELRSLKRLTEGKTPEPGTGPKLKTLQPGTVCTRTKSRQPCSVV